jgi:hypothetical protein
MNPTAALELEVGRYRRPQPYMLDWERDIRTYNARKRALVRNIVLEARRARQESGENSLWARLLHRAQR